VIAISLSLIGDGSAVLTAFRLVGLLDVLHEYDGGGLGRKPCQTGASTVLPCNSVRNAG